MAALSSMRHDRSSPSADNNSLPGKTGDISHAAPGHAGHNTKIPLERRRLRKPPERIVIVLDSGAAVLQIRRSGL
jgi:hypothetical protein